MPALEKSLLIVAMAVIMEIGTFFLLKGQARFQNTRISYVILFGALVNFLFISLMVVWSDIIDAIWKLITVLGLYLYLGIIYQILYSKYKNKSD